MDSGDFTRISCRSNFSNFSTSYAMPLRMGFVMRRNRNKLKLACGVSLLMTTLYFFYSWSNNLDQHDHVTAFLVDSFGNYEPDPDEVISGPGEDGKAHILSDDKQNNASESISEYGMNLACSEEISLNRTILDTRLEECKHWNYPKKLPKTSVIIVFHNEGWSSLLRTVHSVWNRTPHQLLEEILLVDDYSDKSHLKQKLSDYLEKFNGKVKLIRNTQREGLIRTRSKGAVEAKGEVILFLDAHCEVGYNWLPPLIAPISSNRTTMTVPTIDGISSTTWEYSSIYEEGRHFKGIFEWGMLYKETEVTKEDLLKRQHKSSPYKSPTHAGGLFAINRKYFLELGGYDAGLLVWGGENFELSFKIWQCGGSIEWVPCSRVGHVYRSFMPYEFGKLADKVQGPLITYNYKRVIETWFDDKYKEFFYTREPLARFVNMGDISQQVAFKQNNNCKSFAWFMENVAYDVLHKFPELPPNLYWGEIKNTGHQKCLDTLGYSAPTIIGLGHCHGQGSNQMFRLNTKGQLGIGERCVDADKTNVKMVFCNLGTVNGPWQYDPITNTMEHKILKKCLSVYPYQNRVKMLNCAEGDLYQKWHFKEIIPKWG